ncbi:MAG: hypothetical protein WCR08_08485 [Gammaproteobacteria bacterium]|nr:hypothetical protein [Chloroflexota bacterium]
MTDSASHHDTGVCGIPRYVAPEIPEVPKAMPWVGVCCADGAQGGCVPQIDALAWYVLPRCGALHHFAINIPTHTLHL